MANLQVKDLPPEMHERLREIARREGVTLRSIVLDAIQQHLRQEAFRSQLSERAPVSFERPLSSYLHEAREERLVDLAAEPGA